MSMVWSGPLEQHAAAACVVYDECDEVYLGCEKWVDDLWEAATFSQDEAVRTAEHHGGAELDIVASPHSRFDSTS